MLIMIMILIKTTYAYFLQKSKIYIKKVTVMTNNTFALTIGFANTNLLIF